jgi:hypothetical protein
MKKFIQLDFPFMLFLVEMHSIAHPPTPHPHYVSSLSSTNRSPGDYYSRLQPRQSSSFLSSTNLQFESESLTTECLNLSAHGIQAQQKEKKKHHPKKKTYISKMLFQYVNFNLKK